jgi:hypothetical protein
MKHSLENNFVIFILFVFLGCQLNVQYFNRDTDEKDAEKITNQFYDLIKAGKYEETTRLWSKRLFVENNQEKLFKIYTLINRKLGELKDSKIQSWQTRVLKGTNPSGNYVLVYKNKYERCDVEETLCTFTGTG